MISRAAIYRRHRGAVLLLVLLVLVILTPFLASAAQRAVSADAVGREFARELQLRWAQISITDAMISADPFGQTDAETPSVVKFNIRLGQHECQVVVSDEQAKANLNTLLDQLSADRVQTKLRVVTEAGQAVRLRPLSGRNVRAPLVAFTQVFPASAPEMLFASGERAGLTSHITLWGDGRLNLTTASPEAIRLVLDDLLGVQDTKSLLESLSEKPDASLDQLLIELGAEAETIEEASSLITLESNATGVLVRTQHAGHKPRYRWTAHWTVAPPDSNEEDANRSDEDADPGPHTRVILW